MTAPILVVDDEPKIVDIVRRYLERDGHAVRVARDGPSALETFRAERPALVVLDLMLPGLDGLEVCREMRREYPVPIVMLTARADESDTLAGLDLGADDYITKPFSPRELVARVRAVLRRAAAEPPRGAPSVKVGELLVDADRHTASWRGRELSLTPAEFQLLLTLARQPGHVLSRAQLVDLAFGDEFNGFERTVDAHVKNLRRKLRRVSCGDCIETVRGVGYRLAGAAPAGAES